MAKGGKASASSQEQAASLRKTFDHSVPVYKRNSKGKLERTAPSVTESGLPRDHKILVDELAKAQKKGDKGAIDRSVKNVQKSAKNVERNRQYYESLERGVRLPLRPSEEPYIRGETNNKAKGGAIKKMARGGSVSKRADGCAIRGKTKGRIT